MAIYVYIAREEDWDADDWNQISAQEWLTLVKEDPELVLTPLEHEEYYVTWRGHTLYGETWFNWNDGLIHTKNPDKATLLKMYEMAQRLNAQVKFEDLVLSREDIEAYADPDIEEVPPQVKKSESGILDQIKKFLKRT